MRWISSVALTVLALLMPMQAKALEGDREIFPAKGPDAGHLVVHAATDLAAMRPLIDDFQNIYPNIAIEFTDMVTNDLFRQATKVCAGEAEGADILLSSSVDQLVRLANDGCAQPHSSSETKGVPAWANWRDEVFGFTFEPVVFVYDRRTVPPEDVPVSHDALSDLLRRNPEKYRGRVGTYDIAASGVGYLLAFNDSRQAPTANGRLLETLSRTETVIRCCNNEVLGELVAGRISLAYNVLGSYAYAAARANTALGIVLPRDYTLILSRGALIPSRAPHPDLGKTFLNYLLSVRGRRVAQEKSFFFAEDAALPAGVDGPAALVESGIGRPIRIGPALLAAQDEIQRKTFIADWMELIGRTRSDR
ncbi:ABC transporter substrate-binding protein [Mesorhizobium sp. M00.F.Ca.ET.216.01.1.1]|uniref:ABC transporter substrate-binding protein n=1 Tax=Mesorhizobium sp. M00.F.Ca.ET.216.01.1.1 TaxID=2500528 RepID=UPI000FD8DF1C|nr:ABC transporter substrate-binding protein [Mesorhizobium sp. M00.F.Ca.ET.216.01.1.1]TGQ32772.1 ABC transporter substrate-binding protein [Mesorhizobium sp. M00.F.Ca.ET.216.01.1.1]TJW06512.1 MAG: extracellular solute-binding protein [Mesorhizobium sp.]